MSTYTLRSSFFSLTLSASTSGAKAASSMNSPDPLGFVSPGYADSVFDNKPMLLEFRCYDTGKKHWIGCGETRGRWTPPIPDLR